MKSLVLVVIFTVTASAQSIYSVAGRIVDSETRSHIPDVTVSIEGTALASSSDASGRFRFTLPDTGIYSLQFSHVGYAPLTRSVRIVRNSERDILISLSPKTIELNDILIRGDRPFVLTRKSQERALFRVDSAAFRAVHEETMERAMNYLFPDIVRPFSERMMGELSRMRAGGEEEFTLYVDGEWWESIRLDDIDPRTVLRVHIWEVIPLSSGGNVDLTPINLPAQRGARYVILVETSNH